MLKGSWASSVLCLWIVSDSPGELVEHTQAKPLSTSTGSPADSEMHQSWGTTGVRACPSGREWEDWGPRTAHKSMSPWVQSQKGKENKYFCIGSVTLKLYLLYHSVGTSHPISCYCLCSTVEEAFKDRKQLAQGHMGFEPQICLPPEPGCETEA